MAAVPFANININVNVQFLWTAQATIQLIRERRILHNRFDRAPNRSHAQLWTLITNRVLAATGFAATALQCRVKWNALKRGFENIMRIVNNNPQGFPLRSPNSFDIGCFPEMNDQFWVRTSNYFFQFTFQFMFLFKEIIYIFIGFQIILDKNIGGKTPGSIADAMNIDTDHGKGNHGKGNHDQEAEAEAGESSR